MNYSAYFHVFPATFHVISRKIDNLWDSVAMNVQPLRIHFSKRNQFLTVICTWCVFPGFFFVQGDGGDFTTEFVGGKKDFWWSEKSNSCPISQNERNCCVRPHKMKRKLGWVLHRERVLMYCEGGKKLEREKLNKLFF